MSDTRALSRAIASAMADRATASRETAGLLSPSIQMRFLTALKKSSPELGQYKLVPSSEVDPFYKPAGVAYALVLESRENLSAFDVVRSIKAKVTKSDPGNRTNLVWADFKGWNIFVHSHFSTSGRGGDVYSVIICVLNDGSDEGDRRTHIRM